MISKLFHSLIFPYLYSVTPFEEPRLGLKWPVCRWCRTQMRHYLKRECKGEKWKSLFFSLRACASEPPESAVTRRGTDYCVQTLPLTSIILLTQIQHALHLVVGRFGSEIGPNLNRT